MRILPLLLLLAACSGSDPEDTSTTDDTDVSDTEDSDTNDTEDSDTEDTNVEECVSEADVCSFNSDCPTDERCGCDETTGCFCECGERGTGVNGVDTCADGNDCASSLCVEGPGGTYYCSDECADDDGCTGALPICSDIAFVGKICIRDPESAR